MTNDTRCSCGNAFDGNNLCMPSACQWEGLEPEPDSFGAAGYLLPRVIPTHQTATHCGSSCCRCPRCLPAEDQS